MFAQFNNGYLICIASCTRASFPACILKKKIIIMQYPVTPQLPFIYLEFLFSFPDKTKQTNKKTFSRVFLKGGQGEAFLPPGMVISSCGACLFDVSSFAYRWTYGRVALYLRGNRSHVKMINLTFYRQTMLSHLKETALWNTPTNTVRAFRFLWPKCQQGGLQVQLLLFSFHKSCQ